MHKKNMINNNNIIIETSQAVQIMRMWYNVFFLNTLSVLSHHTYISYMKKEKKKN